MQFLESPKSFKQDKAFLILKRGTKRVLFFDFGHETYNRWFDVDTDYFEGGLMSREHHDARVKEMVEKEGYEIVK